MKNLDKGSKSVPVMSECRGIVDDINNNSIKDVTFKAGLLGFYTMSLVNLKASKTMNVGLQSKAQVGMVGFASMAATHQMHHANVPNAG